MALSHMAVLCSSFSKEYEQTSNRRGQPPYNNNIRSRGRAKLKEPFRHEDQSRRYSPTIKGYE
jgi:hypothetical protein